MRPHPSGATAALNVLFRGHGASPPAYFKVDPPFTDVAIILSPQLLRFILILSG